MTIVIQTEIEKLFDDTLNQGFSELIPTQYYDLYISFTTVIEGGATYKFSYSVTDADFFDPADLKRKMKDQVNRSYQLSVFDQPPVLIEEDSWSPMVKENRYSLSIVVPRNARIFYTGSGNRIIVIDPTGLLDWLKTSQDADFDIVPKMISL